MHARKRMMGARVSKELRAKYKLARSVTIRKGDKVKLLIGEKKGHTGKVTEVSYSELKIYIDGLFNKTAKGKEKPKPIDPSNVVIIDGDFGSDRIGK